MIKKLLLTLTVLASLLLPAAAMQPAYAVDVLGNDGSACKNTNATSKPAICKDNSTNADNPIFGKNGILTAVVNILAKVVGLVSIIVIVIAGFRMILSQDPNAASNARRGVVSAAVGLIIALMAQALVSFVLSKL